MNDLPDFSASGYQTIRQLGLNAAGGRVVYLAAESSTQRQVVIKQFQFAKGSGWSEFKAVEREIQVLQGLNHKGIPHYVGSFESNNGYCIVQEYKNAQTLSALHSYTLGQIKQIAVSVLEIIVYLQNRIPPIIHRDIKPENIVVDEQLNVYLIDFGFARLGGGTAAMSSVAAGTFGFMAPEQIYNKDLTEATDLYGLGATLVALLTETKSTEMDTLIDEDNKIAFQPLVPKLSFHFIEWLEKMVAPKLSDRYPDAATALEELQPLDIIRFPSVEFSPPDLEFTATRLGEKLTRTISIINPTPETVLEGKWSVAPHPNDPSLTDSDSHSWISFSPREFKGNQVKCQITVDTSRLVAQANGKRSLILQANTFLGTHTLSLFVNTATFPVLKKLPYFTTALLLIVASLTGFLYVYSANIPLVPKINALIVWTAFGTLIGRVIYAVFPSKEGKLGKFHIYVLLGAILGSLPLSFAVWGITTFVFLILFIFFMRILYFFFIFLLIYPWRISYIFILSYFTGLSRDYPMSRTLSETLSLSVTGVGGVFLFWYLWYVSKSYLLAFTIFQTLFVPIVIAAVVATVAVILEELTGKYLGLDEERRYTSGYLILLMLSTGTFGICLGIGLKIGFVSNLYLLLATLGTGVLSTFLFFFAPLQRHRLLSAYRQREPYLIRP